MNINLTQPDKIQPHLEQITMMCLKIMTDVRCNLIKDEFRVLTAQFVKNVIMNDQAMVQKLQALET